MHNIAANTHNLPLTYIIQNVRCCTAVLPRRRMVKDRGRGWEIKTRLLLVCVWEEEEEITGRRIKRTASSGYNLSHSLCFSASLCISRLSSLHPLFVWSILLLPPVMPYSSSLLSIHVRLISIHPCLCNVPTASWIIRLFMVAHPSSCLRSHTHHSSIPPVPLPLPPNVS